MAAVTNQPVSGSNYLAMWDLVVVQEGRAGRVGVGVGGGVGGLKPWRAG